MSSILSFLAVSLGVNFLKIINENNKLLKDLEVNWIHFKHAIILIIFYNLGFIEELILYSSLFFSFDTLKIILEIKNNNKIFFGKLPYILHHMIALISLYFSYIGYMRNEIIYTLNILESSNILMYINYYAIKKYNEYKNLILLITGYQLVWYSYIRIIVFGLFLIKIYHKLDNLFYIMSLLLYILGIFWSLSLSKKVYYEISKK